MRTETIQLLARLAYNLRWAWHTPSADVFHKIAPHVWDLTHNPIAVVDAVRDTPHLLDAHADLLVAAHADLEAYLNRPPLRPVGPRAAYFSAEFAIAECLPSYSGRLGVLAGDELKMASDVGSSMLGVGLLYRHANFRHSSGLTRDWRDSNNRLEPDMLPLRPVLASDGVPLEIGVPFPGRTVLARVWLAQVGRVPLYLLDTDVARNREDDRWITAYAHEGGNDVRLRQAMLLGIGGARLLRALRLVGLEPAPEVYHLNGTHAAFVVVERAAERMRTTKLFEFRLALQEVASSVALTTHAPLASAHDRFPGELIDAYLKDYRRQLGLTHDEFMSLGRRDAAGHAEEFSMTSLAVRASHVRTLRGVVKRGLEPYPSTRALTTSRGTSWRRACATSGCSWIDVLHPPSTHHAGPWAWRKRRFTPFGANDKA